jgi:tagatose-6-phosphate ketose/aldose isomerase
MRARAPQPAEETAVPTPLSPDFDLAGRGADATVREIIQQPALWREVAADAAARREETDAFLAPVLQRSDCRVVMTGAGSSAFAGQIVASALSRQLGVRIDAVATTDIVSSPQAAFAQDVPTVLVSFARSGDSPESIAATELAEQQLHDVYQVIVTCNRDGQLYRAHAGADRSHVLLMPPKSNDQGFAMTSSFTCMTLAAWLAFSTQPPSDATLDALVRAGERAVEDGFRDAAALVARPYERVVYLGSGALAGLAHEAALKLLELTAGRTVTYYDTALGFRHGPKSVMNDRTLAIVYLSNDPYTRLYDEDIAVELRDGVGPKNVLVIGARPSDRLGELRWRVRDLDDADDMLLSLPFVAYAQTIGLHFALAGGSTPDNPFPSGEVNRVVQGVTIHKLDR